MPDFLFLSYEEFYRHCLELAVKIKQAYGPQKIDYLLSIQRGGAVLSKILSDALEVPITTLVVSSYQDLHQTKQPFISQEVAVDIQGKHVLVLDEISDTGDSLHLVMEHLAKFNTASVKTAVVYLKPKSRFKPDFWMAESASWVVFPGELCETARALQHLPTRSAELEEQFMRYAQAHGASEVLLQDLGVSLPKETKQV